MPFDLESILSRKKTVWYTAEASSAKSYTAEVTGNLSVRRLLAGQKPWMNPFGGIALVPKKLILPLSLQNEALSGIHKLLLYVRLSLMVEEHGFMIHTTSNYFIYYDYVGFFDKNRPVLKSFSCEKECIHTLTSEEIATLASVSSPDAEKHLLTEVGRVKSLLLSSDISTELLFNILRRARNLETLYLRNSRNITLLPEDIRLFRLKTLDAEGSIISTQGWGALLKDGHNLESLELGDCDITGDLAMDIHLPTLKNLVLNGFNISAQILQALLRGAPNLKSLLLMIMHSTGDLPSDICLYALETLKLYDVPGQWIEALLKRVTNLESLVLHNYRTDNCTDISDLLMDICLPALKHFVALRIGPLGVEALLQRSPNLEGLFLTGCNGDLLKNIRLPALKVLGLQDSNISVNECRMFLKETTSLTHLSIDRCRGNISQEDVDALHREYPTLEINFNQYARRPSAPVEGDTLGRGSVDADTRFHPGKKFELKKYLFSPKGQDPDVGHYRLSVYDQVVCSPSSDINDAFRLEFSKMSHHDAVSAKQRPSDVWELVKEKTQDASQCWFYGKISLEAGVCQPLPSIAPNETLTDYHTDKEAFVKITYSKTENLYYACSNVACTLDFVLKRPQKAEPALPQDIMTLVEHYQSFGIGALENIQPGQNHREALETQKKGACRHRTALFWLAMQEKYPQYPVRVIHNDCHSFVEVKIKERWVRMDLGGYPAQLKIDASYEPRKDQPQVATETSLWLGGEAKYFRQKTPPLSFATPLQFAAHILQTPNKASLIQCDSPEKLSQAREAFFHYCVSIKRPFFYIHAPEDMLCQSDYVQLDENLEASFQKGPGGALYRFLEVHKNAKPVLIINYNFKKNDIAGFSPILGDAPKADGIPLPIGTQVIGIRNKNQPGCYQGEDGLSRFDDKQDYPFAGDPLAAFRMMEEVTRAEVIECYNSPDWESILLGRFDLIQDKLVFCEGKLVKAIREGKKSIILRNAPWQNDGFLAFWQKLLVTKNVDVFGQTFTLPADFLMHHTRGYVLEKPEAERTLPEDFQVLNPETFPLFLSDYVCENRKLRKTGGIVESHAHNTLRVYVSDEISESAWAELLVHCKQHDVTLQSVYPVSTDRESFTTEANAFQEAYQDALVIDVSEMHYSALVRSIDGRFNAQKISFEFNEQEGVLLKALNEGKTVILTGAPPAALMQRLMPFLLERAKDKTAKGRFLIASEKPVFIPGIPCYLDKIPPKFCDSQTLPKDSGDDARLKAVEDTLAHFPYVFLTGLSGVGKTTFVQQVWAERHPHIYYGEEKLKAWAEDMRPGTKTLFIDEANITPTHWSIFEGLFQKSPHIMIDHVLYPLTLEHKVIFAGNPLSYGGERQLPSLFSRHAGSIQFEPLSMAYLKENILLPLLNKIPGLQANAEIWLTPILNIADFLTKCSTTDILFTPRELEMMLLLSINAHLKHPHLAIETIVPHFAYQLAKPFVPQANQADFDKAFQPKERLWDFEPSVLCKDILIHATNRPAYHTLMQLLDLRDRRRTAPGFPVTGGLGGLIIEGPPGVGKSELVRAVLESRGLFTKREVHWIPVKMALVEKEALILRAFHNGDIVVIDKINCAPMMEQLLNTLLMGKDLNGEPAKKPGFMVIGTQNPGHIQASPALMHRLHTISLHDYTLPEMVEILLHKGLDKKTATELAVEYLTVKDADKLCMHHLFKLTQDLVKSTGIRGKITQECLREIQNGNIEALGDVKGQEQAIAECVFLKEDLKQAIRIGLQVQMKQGKLLSQDALEALRSLQKMVYKDESLFDKSGLEEVFRAYNDRLFYIDARRKAAIQKIVGAKENLYATAYQAYQEVMDGDLSKQQTLPFFRSLHRTGSDFQKIMQMFLPILLATEPSSMPNKGEKNTVIKERKGTSRLFFSKFEEVMDQHEKLMETLGTLPKPMRSFSY